MAVQVGGFEGIFGRGSEAAVLRRKEEKGIPSSEERSKALVVWLVLLVALRVLLAVLFA